MAAWSAPTASLTTAGSASRAGGSLGPAAAPPHQGVDLGGRWLLPGFIDEHVHGGGGYDMTASPDEMADAVAFHRRHGTTRTLVSLATAPPYGHQSA